MSTHNKDNEEQPAAARPVLFTKEGKPLRVLSTSLGIALVANALLGTSFAGDVSAEPNASQAAAADANADEPKLVEWSNEAVKAYFDPAADWNIPVLQECGPAADGENAAVCEEEGSGSGSGTGGTSSGSAAGGGTTIIRTYSSFGWDDLLLYHMMFNNGSSYSTSTFHSSRRSYDVHTGAAYKAPTYKSDSFQNSPVTGSAVRPKTTNTTGSITKRSSTSSPSSSTSTSSSAGGIGGKSSSFSSSGSSSSKSSGGFFGG